MENEINMMVLYDFEVSDCPYERQLNALAQGVLSELRVFILQRLKPLAKEMALEEVQSFFCTDLPRG